MCYPVCGMVHLKEPFLLVGKSSPCSGGRRFCFGYHISKTTCAIFGYTDSVYIQVDFCMIKLTLYILSYSGSSICESQFYYIRLVPALPSMSEGRKEIFYLTTHSTHFIYGYMASDIW